MKNRRLKIHHSVLKRSNILPVLRNTLQSLGQCGAATKYSPWISLKDEREVNHVQKAYPGRTKKRKTNMVIGVAQAGQLPSNGV